MTSDDLDTVSGNCPIDGLTDREVLFLSKYKGPGSGAEAASQAGYTGNRATLKSRASKILAKPEAQTWLATYARPEAPAADAPELSEMTPKAILESISRDPTALPSSRVRAAELLRREELAAQTATVDPFAELRAKVNDIIRAKRRREREEGR